MARHIRRPLLLLHHQLILDTILSTPLSSCSSPATVLCEKTETKRFLGNQIDRQIKYRRVQM